MRSVRPILFLATIVLAGLVALAASVMTVIGVWIAFAAGEPRIGPVDMHWRAWASIALLAVVATVWAARRLRAGRLAVEDEPVLWI